MDMDMDCHYEKEGMKRRRKEEQEEDDGCADDAAFPSPPRSPRGKVTFDSGIGSGRRVCIRFHTYDDKIVRFLELDLSSIINTSLSLTHADPIGTIPYVQHGHLFGAVEDPLRFPIFRDYNNSYVTEYKRMPLLSKTDVLVSGSTSTMYCVGGDEDMEGFCDTFGARFWETVEPRPFPQRATVSSARRDNSSHRFRYLNMLGEGADKRRWKVGEWLLSPRYRTTKIVVGESLFLVGGNRPFDHFMEEFRPADRRCYEIPHPPFEKAAFKKLVLASLGDKLLAMTRYNVDNMFVYDTKKRFWSKFPNEDLCYCLSLSYGDILSVAEKTSLYMLEQDGVRVCAYNWTSNVITRGAIVGLHHEVVFQRRLSEDDKRCLIHLGGDFFCYIWRDDNECFHQTSKDTSFHFSILRAHEDLVSGSLTMALVSCYCHWLYGMYSIEDAYYLNHKMRVPAEVAFQPENIDQSKVDPNSGKGKEKRGYAYTIMMEAFVKEHSHFQSDWFAMEILISDVQACSECNCVNYLVHSHSLYLERFVKTQVTNLSKGPDIVPSSTSLDPSVFGEDWYYFSYGLVGRPVVLEEAGMIYALVRGGWISTFNVKEEIFIKAPIVGLEQFGLWESNEHCSVLIHFEKDLFGLIWSMFDGKVTQIHCSILKIVEYRPKSSLTAFVVGCFHDSVDGSLWVGDAFRV